MQQRTYHGTIEPQEMADFLVSHFDPQENLQAQQIGQSGTQLVQIGRGDVPKDLRHAVTVAIAPASDGGVTVTMGQQQWLTPENATFGAAAMLIGALVTPFALFALLWPISDAVGSASLPADIWSALDTFAASKGATMGAEQTLQHPHFG